MFLVLILYCEEGSELVVFIVSDSLFILAEAGTARISIFATSTTNSYIGRCGRGVFNSTNGFSLCGIVARDESRSRLDPACDPRTNFWISTNMVSILHTRFTKMGMIFAAKSYPLVLMSLSKRRTLFRTLPGFPTTS